MRGELSRPVHLQRNNKELPLVNNNENTSGRSTAEQQNARDERGRERASLQIVADSTISVIGRRRSHAMPDQ